MDPPQPFNQHLMLLYGEAGRSLNKEIQKLRLNSAKLINKKNFLIRCREIKVAPRGLTSNINKFKDDPVVMKKKEELDLALIRKDLQSTRAKINETSRKIGEVETSLRQLFTERDFTECQRLTNNMREKEFVKIKQRQVRKFQNMAREKREE